MSATVGGSSCFKWELGFFMVASSQLVKCDLRAQGGVL